MRQRVVCGSFLGWSEARQRGAAFRPSMEAPSGPVDLQRRQFCVSSRHHERGAFQPSRRSARPHNVQRIAFARRECAPCEALSRSSKPGR